MKDEKHVLSSRPYILLNDQLQHFKVELERYQSRMESLQVDYKSSCWHQLFNIIKLFLKYCYNSIHKYWNSSCRLKEIVF